MDMENWRQAVSEKLNKLSKRLNGMTPSMLYGTLCSATILPVISAATQGDFASVAALTGVVGGVGGNLIANQIQSWRDRSEEDLATELINNAQGDDQWRQTLDTLLAEFQAPHQIQANLNKADRTWFTDTLKDQLAQLDSNFTLHRDGTLVMGDRNVVAENISDSVIQTGNGSVSTGGEWYIGTQYINPANKYIRVKKHKQSLDA